MVSYRPDRLATPVLAALERCLLTRLVRLRSNARRVPHIRHLYK